RPRASPCCARGRRRRSRAPTRSTGTATAAPTCSPDRGTPAAACASSPAATWTTCEPTSCRRSRWDRSSPADLLLLPLRVRDLHAGHLLAVGAVHEHREDARAVGLVLHGGAHLRDL